MRTFLHASRFFVPIVLAAYLTGSAFAGLTADSKSVAKAETAYADVNDAISVITTIDSGLFSSYRGKDRAGWVQFYEKKRRELQESLGKLPQAGLSEGDAKAVAAMKAKVAGFPESISAPFSPKGDCRDAQRKDLDYAALRKALVVCFVQISNHMSFAGGTINRVSALDLLHQLDGPEQRRAVFQAFLPLWQSINGNNEPDSPYRRMMAMAAADAAKNGSEIDGAARSVGVETADVEKWLVKILEAWRDSTSDQPVEPWDFRYQGSVADRQLAALIPRESLQAINQRYYSDLGADLSRLGTLYDLSPRSGKAALAYTDFVIHGRMVHGSWQPTIARVSAPYERGGLFVLNELVHENGHVVNITAIRNRPAFLDWSKEDVFSEAIADVPAWSTYEPVWQRHYLGHEVSEQDGLRGLYTVVVLDVAWSLFELRMLQSPKQDPSALWTDITHRYLHIVPHPEMSWWAMRVQLVDSPGYMLNYGFGAILTADVRQRIRDELGPFDTGDPRWYAWVSERLLRYGSERDTKSLLQEFLGRPVSPQALLDQIHRLGPIAN